MCFYYYLLILVGAAGVEPETFSTSKRRSAIELRAHWAWKESNLLPTVYKTVVLTNELHAHP